MLVLPHYLSHFFIKSFKFFSENADSLSLLSHSFFIHSCHHHSSLTSSFLSIEYVWAGFKNAMVKRMGQMPPHQLATADFPAICKEEMAAYADRTDGSKVCQGVHKEFTRVINGQIV